MYQVRGKGGVKAIIQMHTEGTIFKADVLHLELPYFVKATYWKSIICHLTATTGLAYITKMYQRIHLT